MAYRLRITDIYIECDTPDEALRAVQVLIGIRITNAT